MPSKAIKKYLEIERRLALKPGDLVQVVKKVNSYSFGWCCSWVREMDMYVGKVCRISGTYAPGSVLARGVYLGSPYGGSSYAFPVFVLKVVERREACA